MKFFSIGSEDKKMKNIDLYIEALKRKGIELNKPATVKHPLTGNKIKVIVLETDTGLDLYTCCSVSLIRLSTLAFDEDYEVIKDDK